MKEKQPGVLKRLAGALAPTGEKVAIMWQPAGRNYPRLAALDTRNLAGRPGLYLVWHLGVRPQWLRAGFTADLNAAAILLAKTPEITAFEPHDGPFFSWSPCAAQAAPGYLNFLVARLSPTLQDLAFACDVPLNAAAAAIPCALPAGTKEIQNTSEIHADRT